MEYGAIDLHLRRSQVRILDEGEQVLLDRRIDTTRGELARIFASRARMRILVESSIESEWVAQHLESLGHEVVVADPNYAAMYGARLRKVKTDRRDVAALAIANRRGVYRPGHRVSPAARTRRQQMRIRRQLVHQRTGLINLVRALVRHEGLQVPSGKTELVLTKLDQVPVSPTLLATLAPLRAVLAALNETIGAMTTAVAAHAASDPATQRLMTVPGVGPILAVTFQAVLDTPGRFGGDAARASAFVGVVPSERSSAERQQKGRITKAGSPDVRALLAQASWAISRSRSRPAAALREWVHALAARRGRNIAIVSPCAAG